MVALGSIIPWEQSARRVSGMTWMPVSGVLSGISVEYAEHPGHASMQVLEFHGTWKPLERPEKNSVICSDWA